MRIAVVGKTGSGKSSLVHVLFGEQQCPKKSVFNSETTRCEAKTKDVNGKRITLVDTPGFFDTDMSEDELKAEILRCITECAPGPHAFLIVLKIERFTEHEQSVFTKMCEYFSDEAFKHAVVVFTHGDQLPEGSKIAEFVHENKLLSDLVKKCGNRCHVVDNKYWREGSVDEYRSNQFQVKELLHTVETMMKTNKNSFFTNEMLKNVDEEIRKEEARIRQESGDKSEEEIKQKAKDNLFGKLWIRLTGIASGALIGALFSVVLAGSVKEFVSRNLITKCFKMCGGKYIFLKTLLVSAAVGAVVGGYAGFIASDGAETPKEAAKRTSEAVNRIAMYVKGVAQDTLNDATNILNESNLKT
ncbi:GTPase IMAP family member 7 [Oryzias melastigma]|uniref:GTPase IMAP family member 7 n=1 Tax=Oryzias melastigma TaxID=30732 RepID=A0A834FG33_ORYME|nr:GTPase IMAP family member 7 [Oryzias melastigma]